MSALQLQCNNLHGVIACNGAMSPMPTAPHSLQDTAMKPGALLRCSCKQLVAPELLQACTHMKPDRCAHTATTSAEPV